MKKGAIFGKKQFVMAVLVMALGVAVYLNFALVPPGSEAAGMGDTAEKSLGETIYVNGSTQSETGSMPAVSSKAAVSQSAQAAGGDYFAQARSDREKAHNDALATLKEIINNVKTDAPTKEKVSATASLLAKNIEKEIAIETLLKGKGYSDAVAVLADDNAIIIVKSANLLDSQTLQIQDIVISQTKLSLDKITIVPKK